jgi:hypothetical protein
MNFWVYLKLVSEYHFRYYFRKFAKNEPLEFSSPNSVGMFPLTRTVGELQVFRRITSGVTPKRNTDFQNTPNGNIFRIGLR